MPFEATFVRLFELPSKDDTKVPDKHQKRQEERGRLSSNQTLTTTKIKW